MQLIDKLLMPAIYLLLGLAILLLAAARLPAEDILGDRAPVYSPTDSRPAPHSPAAHHKAHRQAKAPKHHRASHHKHKAKPAPEEQAPQND